MICKVLLKIFVRKLVLDCGMLNTYCVINCYSFTLLRLVKFSFFFLHYWNKHYLITLVDHGFRKQKLAIGKC